jgi:hypothetical protein
MLFSMATDYISLLLPLESNPLIPSLTADWCWRVPSVATCCYTWGCMDTCSQPLLPPPPGFQSTNPQQPQTQSAPRNQHNFFRINRHNQQRFKAIVHILRDYSIKNTSPYFQASGRLVRSTWYHILSDHVQSRNRWTNPTAFSLPQSSARPTLSSWILQAQLKVVVKE